MTLGKCGKLIEQLLTTFSAPSQDRSLSRKSFTTMGSVGAFNLLSYCDEEYTKTPKNNTNHHAYVKTDLISKTLL